MAITNLRLNNLTVRADGVIVSYGEYYLEPRYVPYFDYRVRSHGPNYREKDAGGALWSVCQVTMEERIAFYPDLEQVATVAIRREGGSVLSWVRSCLYQNRYC